MNDFYLEKIKPYADKIKAYISGEEFREFFKSVNGEYLCNNYYDFFVKHTIGGKCVRGYLVFLFTKLFGGSETQATLKVATALELFESAVLMHDDIIDYGRVRRGMPSAYVALGDDHTGKSRAICLGDAGLITAIALLEDCPAEVRRFLTTIFLRTISGELADIDVATKRKITDNDVIAVYIEKTATYTLLAPSMCGALLCGKVSEETATAIEIYATYMGISFQIKDDLLGLFGNETVIGKNGDADIAEGKKSLLVSRFDNVATAEQKRIFCGIYGKGAPTAEDAETIRKLFTESGSRDYAEKKMLDYYEKASAQKDILVNLVKPSEDTKKELQDFTCYLIKREK